MIARTWHGRIRSYDTDAYREYMISTGIKELRSTPGNLGVQYWVRKEGNITHVWIHSWWKDYDAIRAFAGEEFEKPRYYEEDIKYLLEMEPRVQHAEVIDFPPLA